MKNKKGFTLIELLAVISLIAIISVVTGFSISSMLENQQLKEKKEYISKLEDAACVYAELDNDTCLYGCDLTTETLINRGLLSKNLLNPLTEDKTDTVVNDEHIIKVTWNSEGKKSCIYDIEYVNSLEINKK